MKNRKIKIFYLLLYGLYILGFVTVGYLFLRGFSYYILPLDERIHASLHPLWKPGGRIGHALGIIGSAMMILMLLYSVRKRVSYFEKLGPLNYWLHIHIYFGIFGPLFVILHSSFKLNGIVSVAFWSMIAVAISGLIGRFLYLQIPRDIFGNELTLIQAKDIESKLIHELKEIHGFSENEIIILSRKIIKDINIEWSTLRVLFVIFWQNLTLRFRRKKVLYQIFRVVRSSEIALDVFDRLVEQAKLQQRIELWARLHSIFHYWHVFHRPFAYIMYLIMIIHIAIAIWLGYTWF
jgi:hypothetical protein